LIQVTTVPPWRDGNQTSKGGLLVNKEDLPIWDPSRELFPSGKVLFVTGSLGKIVGLVEHGLGDYFVAWTPKGAPTESNHMKIENLIVEKGKNLVAASVTQLRNEYDYDEKQLPEFFVVGDTHPRIRSQCNGMEWYLVKPDGEMSINDLYQDIHIPWRGIGNHPVTVELSSAYVLMRRNGRLVGHNANKTDTIFMTYASNPLLKLSDVIEYVDYLKNARLEGVKDWQVVKTLRKVAGGVFHEYLYGWARARGINVTISSALSSDWDERESVFGIGDGGLSPALIGWLRSKIERLK